METEKADELNAIQEMAARFAARELEPTALERDRYPFAQFNTQAVDMATSVGLLAPTLPEAQGGTGLGMEGLARVLRALAEKDASTAMIVFEQSLARAFLCQFSLPGQEKKWHAAPKGAKDLIALPLYDDPEELPQTIEALPTQHGYELTGSLDYLPCLPVAQAAIAPAVFQNRPALFLVELQRPGVRVGDPVVSLGLRGCPVADLELDHVVLPETCRLGDETATGVYAGMADGYRGPLSAVALGILEGCYTAALIYARDRYQAKKQIIEHHMVRRMLANMAAWIHMGAAGVSYVCRAADQSRDRDGTGALSIQELLTTAVSRAVTDGVQILGGYGYMREYGQEKRMRDAKQLQAVFGSSPVRSLRILERRLEDRP
jgi:alkylation response protein AidB-like acyl-CoA dehydrogenase